MNNQNVSIKSKKDKKGKFNFIDFLLILIVLAIIAATVYVFVPNHGSERSLQTTHKIFYILLK